MKMKLEFFPNEVLLHLFDYISIIEIFRSFSSLNQRFNQLIFIYIKANFHLNLRSKFLCDLISICRLYLPQNVNEIFSHCFSNPHQIPLEIQFTSDYQLINLHSLTFYHIFSTESMIEILSKLNNYPHLTHLNLVDCYFESYNQINNDIIDKIWSLSKLKRFYISIIFGQKNVTICPSVYSSSIKSVSIQNINLSQNSLNNLFQYTPHLQSLDVHLEKSQKYVDIKSLPYLIKFKFIEKEEIDYNPLIKDERLMNILQTMPNLYSLSIDTSYMFLDGYQWQNIIMNSLPKLKIFRCKMEKFIHKLQNINTEIDQLLQSFQTPYWLETHQWFIRCHWNTKALHVNRILYYTLPYRFQESIVLNDYLWSKSTFPQENDHWPSNSIHRLEYRSIFSNYSFLMYIQFLCIEPLLHCCENLNQFFHPEIESTRSSLISKELMQACPTPTLSKTCPIPRFPIIYELTIHRPIDKYFSYFIPNLRQLNSLHVLLYNNHDITQYQLQSLLDQAQNLSSLSIIHYIHTHSKFFLENLKSQTIYQLNLRKISQSYASIAYDMEQCIALTRSPLGKQVEILTIRVTDKYCIKYLVNHMIHLRMLTVHRRDYQYDQSLKSNENLRALFAMQNDRLTQWLQMNLPSTVKIIRYEYPIDTIHIWIR